MGANLDELMRLLTDELPDPKVSGRGVVTHPPDAVQRVRKELDAATDPARRSELEAVLADLTKGT